MSWEAIAALATFAAVVVALIPIGQDARRRRAAAINLRIRIIGKLVLLRPSLRNITQRGKGVRKLAVMSRTQFAETVRAVGNMLAEASVLRPVEQDELNTVFLDLELAAPIYGSVTFKIEWAEGLLGEIDKIGATMDKWSVFRRKTRKLLLEKREKEKESLS